MTLRLVKDGEAGEDEEAVGVACRAAARLVDTVKAGGDFWLLTSLHGDVGLSYVGGKLETSALAEEVARSAKLAALGIPE